MASITFRWNSTGVTVAGVTFSPSTSNTNLYSPYAVVVDASNTIYVADYSNNRVQRFLSGSLSGVTVAGQSTGVSGSGLTSLNGPNGIALGASGDLYVADNLNHRIQLWLNGSSSGSTVAGTGEIIRYLALGSAFRSFSLYFKVRWGRQILIYRLQQMFQ